MSEPVMWGKYGQQGRKVRARVWDEKTKQWINPVDEIGRPIYEKVPQIGHEGDIKNARPMRHVRSVRYLKQDGHVVDVVVTNAAAHVHGADESYLRDRRAKARYFGWIEEGCCPLIEVMAQKVYPGHLIAPENRKPQPPCSFDAVGPGKPPCPHYLAEMKARRAARAEENRKILDSEKSDATKQTEALNELVTRIVDTAPAKGSSK